jgi:hypothetical protein
MLDNKRGEELAGLKGPEFDGEVIGRAGEESTIE